jgi:hypothetical protein
LGVHYLSGSITYDPIVKTIEPTIASKIVLLDYILTNVDRTPRNTNMLMWHKELWLIGEDKSNYLPAILENPHVKHFPSTWNVEPYVQKCSETAGIQLGRTTIEGWMCNKPSWIYKVDSGGFILNKEKFEVPSDLEKYYSSNVARKIKEEYIKIL